MKKREDFSVKKIELDAVKVIETRLKGIKGREVLFYTSVNEEAANIVEELPSKEQVLKRVDGASNMLVGYIICFLGYQLFW